MKKLGRLVVFAVCLGWGLGGVQAQESLSVTTAETPPPLPFPLVAPAQVPVTGTFYTVQHPPGDFPPLPYNPVADFDVPVYWLGTNNWFLVDDRSIDYQALENELAAASLLTTMSTLDSEGPPPFPGDGDTNGTGGGTWEYTPRVFGSNDLYLTLVSDSLTNGTATLLIHNPESLTNEPIWFVWGTTNLSFATDPWALDADNWTWLAATEAGQTNLTVPLLGDGPGFYRLADPANDSDQDGITDYQSWFYFGHALGWASDNSRAADDYDADGTSNLNELTNGTDPNDIHFTLLATNEYFNTAAAPLVATVTAGVPAQVAALVDSTNFSSAIWIPYTTSNLLISLDSDGWHDVWVALHGRAAGPVTNWQMIRLKRDTQPPALTARQKSLTV